MSEITMQTQSGSEKPLIRYFEIPQDVIHDLVYCQQALANHIFVHQVGVDAIHIFSHICCHGK